MTASRCFVWAMFLFIKLMILNMKNATRRPVFQPIRKIFWTGFLDVSGDWVGYVSRLGRAAKKSLCRRSWAIFHVGCNQHGRKEISPTRGGASSSGCGL